MTTPDDVVAALLPTVRTVAVVGVSDRFTRPSFHLAAYLLDRTSWEVTLVNPHVPEVMSRVVSPTLPSVDLVVIFRRPDAVPEMLADAAAAGARAAWVPEEPPSTPDGMTVVAGRSLKDDHKRWCV